jgi:raffinose/stachyose/melibiose transport system permease protein
LVVTISRTASRERTEKAFVSRRYPLALAFPAVLIYVVFFLLSVIGAFALAFSDWNVTRPNEIRFVGLQNFAELIGEEQFRTALRNTLGFAIATTLLKLVLGTALALMLDLPLRARNGFRAVFFLPYLLSAYAIGYLFTFIFHPTHGLLNLLLGLVRLGSHDWLGDPSLAFWSIVGVDVWIGTGFSATLILAGLQSVPQELKEAAAVDGASATTVLRKITIPFILPAVGVVLVLNIIGGLRVFDIVQALTLGGPGWATEVISSMLYKSLAVGALGYSAAIGLTQFILVALASIPVMNALRAREIEL